MPESTMHKLHRGERPNPTFGTLRLIARGYGRPVSEIAAMLGDGGDARDGQEETAVVV